MYRLLLCLPLCLVMAPDTLPPKAPPPPAALATVVDDGAALPQTDDLVTLANKAPVAFLEKVIIRYERDTRTYQGYTCLLVKRERLGGKLTPPEKTQEAAGPFRDNPHS